MFWSNGVFIDVQMQIGLVEFVSVSDLLTEDCKCSVCALDIKLIVIIVSREFLLTDLQLTCRPFNCSNAV